jgi:hypothetical protein
MREVTPRGWHGGVGLSAHETAGAYIRFCTVGRPWRMGKASTIRLMAWTVWEGVLRALMTGLIAYFIVLYMGRNSGVRFGRCAFVYCARHIL